LDGVPFVIHDETIDRTSLESIRGRCCDMLSRELRKVRICKRTNSVDIRVHAFIPTLDEVLGLVADSKVKVLIELKARVSLPVKFGCRPCGRVRTYEGLVEAVLKSARRFPDTDIVFQSFCREYLEEIHRRSPDIELHLLAAGWTRIFFSLSVVWDMDGVRLAIDPIRNLRRDLPIASVNVSKFLVTLDSVRRAKARGLRVFVWTVDDRAEMKKLISWGVDGIITNKPDLLLGLSVGRSECLRK